MATVASDSGGMRSGKSLADTIDHWKFVIMAAFFVFTALVGFIPTSMMLLQAVEDGQHALIHPALHTHAVLMGSWLLLLLTQSTLMATGRDAYHKKLGMVAFLHVPAIVITGCVVVKVVATETLPIAVALNPDQADFLWSQLFSLVIFLIREGILFLLFMGWALLVRGKDSELHKRFVFLATALVMTAAFERLNMAGFVSKFGLSREAFWDICTLIWISPLVLWDLYRTGTIHRAYRIWISIWVLAAIPVYTLKQTDWWDAKAAALLGVSV